MGKNIMLKNLLQSIRRSLGRYIAIIGIIALGAAIFVGLRTTKSDMIVTGQDYMDKQNMFDLRLLSTYGWTQEDVDKIAQMDGVADAEGVITLDAIVSNSGSDVESVYKLYSIPDTVNKVYLLGGRMPAGPDECLIDGAYATDEVLGTTITVLDTNEDETLESLKHHTFTVVGYISTPLYMDMSRGSTTLGNGSVGGYLYLTRDCFDVDYFTEIDITIPGAYEVYTDEYNTILDRAAEYFEPLLMPLAQDRYASVRQEAEDAYNEGLTEYQDGLKEYEDGKREAELQFADALQQLLDGEEEIEANRQLLLDGQQQIADGRKQLEDTEVTLAQSRRALSQAKASTNAQLAAARNELEANQATVNDGLTQVNDGIAQIDAGLAQLDDGIYKLETLMTAADLAISAVDSLISTADSNIAAAQLAIDQARESGIVSDTIIQSLEAAKQQLVNQRDGYVARRQELVDACEPYRDQISELYAQRETIVAQRTELENTKQTLDDAMAQIEAGFAELEASEAEAQEQFAQAEDQISYGYYQLEKGREELDAMEQEVNDGLEALNDAEDELEESWEEYRKGKDEAMRELSDVQLQLSDGLVELREARELIDSFAEPEVFVLDRNTNVGYVSLDSNSDIVEGISAVFPAFFLLVAALVCITTMTRMVEEERTQIGTLKALGYGNGAIIGKYLAYAGSAAILGCGLGVIVGSIIFPLILWQAYGIILNLTPHLILQFDPWLCIPVVVAYTAVTMLVTWYCCRMALREVPAELIRPKAPTTGRKIFLEYLPFWDKISFLNKVMLRNIFRYRQRLLMMMVGIGGCTALLLTGFGVRDSIVDIVNYQFAEVTLFDMEVRFAEGMKQDDQDEFRSEYGRYVDDIGFFYQTSVEMDYADVTKDITMIVSDQGIDSFFDFHDDTGEIQLPGIGETILSIGVAEKMGIQVGDIVTLRTADMDTLELKVSGIFNNNVNNFAIVSSEAVAAQWGEVPESQMAYITVRDDQDVHYASARIGGAEGVMNVTVSKDLAEQVGSMLDALNLVVVTVVICAGMLAVIVLYNLTNINITERIREIATIKVLGFHADESAAYVFKENLLLSAMGSVAGLFGGMALLTFVMSQIKVDMVWFEARLLPMSYVWAIVLTMLSAVLVDFLLYFKLEKINMAEALKSVE